MKIELKDLTQIPTLGRTSVVWIKKSGSLTLDGSHTRVEFI